MRLRRFEYLVVELSVAVGRVVPRYALWLELHELGWDPASLSREAVCRFCDERLESFLAGHGVELDPRQRRRLRRRLARFDPRYPTPEETMARLLSPKQVSNR